jgi:hypothetical protein
MFDDGRLQLPVLVADLEFLLSALENLDENVRVELRERWGVLEEVYSVSVAMNDGRLAPLSQEVVTDAVRALRERLHQLVASVPESAD